jgi:hypothetical protein
MGEDAKADGRADRLVGVAGVLMALCSLAGHALLGAAAGAAIGYGLGIAAALVIVCLAVMALWRGRAGTRGRC